jgi:hypothetical protein
VRWPPWRRDGDGAGTAAPMGADRAAAVDGPPPWLEVPALQRTFGPVPATCKNGSAVRDDLAAPRPTRLSRPLGHHLTADGPTGYLLDLAVARPVAQRSDAATSGLPLAPPPSPPAGRRPVTAGTTTPTLPPVEPVLRFPPVTAPDPAAPLRTAPVPDDAIRRRAMAVEPPAGSPSAGADDELPRLTPVGSDEPEPVTSEPPPPVAVDAGPVPEVTVARQASEPGRTDGERPLVAGPPTTRPLAPPAPTDPRTTTGPSDLGPPIQRLSLRRALQDHGTDEHEHADTPTLPSREPEAAGTDTGGMTPVEPPPSDQPMADPPGTPDPSPALAAERDGDTTGPPVVDGGRERGGDAPPAADPALEASVPDPDARAAGPALEASLPDADEPADPPPETTGEPVDLPLATDRTLLPSDDAPTGGPVAGPSPSPGPAATLPLQRSAGARTDPAAAPPVLRAVTGERPVGTATTPERRTTSASGPDQPLPSTAAPVVQRSSPRTSRPPAAAPGPTQPGPTVSRATTSPMVGPTPTPAGAAPTGPVLPDATGGSGSVPLSLRSPATDAGWPGAPDDAPSSAGRIPAGGTTGDTTDAAWPGAPDDAPSSAGRITTGDTTVPTIGDRPLLRTASDSTSADGRHAPGPPPTPFSHPAPAAPRTTAAPSTVQRRPEPVTPVRLPATPSLAGAPARTPAGVAGPTPAVAHLGSQTTSTLQLAPVSAFPAAPRLPEPWTGSAQIPGTAGPGVAAPTSGPLTLVRQVSTGRSSAPAEPSPQVVQLLAAAGAAAVANGVAQRADDGALEFRPPAADTAPATPTATAPAAEPTAGPTAPGAAAPTDLDELAHKLYDRIRWRLRNELRLDMERAGRGSGLLR